MKYEIYRKRKAEKISFITWLRVKFQLILCHYYDETGNWYRSLVMCILTSSFLFEDVI